MTFRDIFWCMMDLERVSCVRLDDFIEGSCHIFSVRFQNSNAPGWRSYFRQGFLWQRSDANDIQTDNLHSHCAASIQFNYKRQSNMVIIFSHGFPHLFWLVVFFSAHSPRTRTVAHKSNDGFGLFFFHILFPASSASREHTHTLDKHQFIIFGRSNWWRHQYVRPQLLPFIFDQILRPTKNNCQIYFD